MKKVKNLASKDFILKEIKNNKKNPSKNYWKVLEEIKIILDI